MLTAAQERRRTGGALGVLLVLGGCGPATLLAPPPELPAELAGRRLWHTPAAYIYAKDKAAAGETDRWVIELGKHIRQRWGAELGKGLIVVVDAGEQPCVRALDRMVALQDSVLPPTEPRSVEDVRSRLAESGLTEEMVLQVSPIPLDAEALVSLGLSPALPGSADWSMATPSQRLMERTTLAFAPKAVEKKAGPVFAIMAAPLMPAASITAAKAFRLARDGLAFDMWTARAGRWSLEQRRELSRRYARHRARQIDPLLSLALAMADKQERQEREQANGLEGD